jgi:hypothetical protein
MRGRISRWSICGEFFDSKKDLKDQVDKNHRITISKMVAVAAEITNQAADSNN